MIEKTVRIQTSVDSGATYHETRIFSIGVGTLTPRFAFEEKDEISRKRHMQLAAQGYSEGGDWVILQIPDLSNRKCRKLSSQSLRPSEIVQMVSFDCWHQGSSSWITKRIGRVTAFAANSVILPELDNHGFFAPVGTIVSSMDARECSSGSAFLNSKGEVSGVLSVVAGTRKGAARTIGLSVERILELMPANKKLEMLSLNSKCDL